MSNDAVPSMGEQGMADRNRSGIASDGVTGMVAAVHGTPRDLSP